MTVNVPPAPLDTASLNTASSGTVSSGTASSDTVPFAADQPVVPGAVSHSLTIGVLALQGDVREHVAALASIGARAIPVRRPEELDRIQGLVIPGGESTTICRLLDVFELREPLVAKLRNGLAAYGSCAGMITLASTILDGRDDQVPLGAIDIAVRRNAFGRQVDSFETDLAIDGFAEAGLDPAPLRAIFIRAPWVESVGAGVQVLAATSDGHPVAVRQGRVLATSFHPEIAADGRVHRLFLQMAAAS